MSAQKPENAALALLFAAFVGLGCDRGPGAAPQPSATTPQWPAGVVMAVGSRAISAEEVDLASVWIQSIEPGASPAHLRRLTFTNVILPRAIAHEIDPAGRERALAQARERLTELRSGKFAGPLGPSGVLGEYLEGPWTKLGLPGWGALLDAPDGEWSEPIEDAGSWVLMRRLWRREGATPAATVLAVDVLRFDWLDAATRRASIDSAMDRLPLTIVDPAWREVVPELIQHRMKSRR